MWNWRKKWLTFIRLIISGEKKAKLQRQWQDRAKTMIFFLQNPQKTTAEYVYAHSFGRKWNNVKYSEFHGFRLDLC